VDTYAADTLMPDGKTLQLPSTHMLGQNFSRAFNVRYMNEDGSYTFGWQTCYGPAISRIYAALFSMHGDNKGLVYPFELAPVQVIIIPIVKKETEAEVRKKVEVLKPRTVRVPIPDPTPDEPEPVREIEPEESLPDVVPDDVIFGVPDAPPAPVEDTGPIRVGGQIKEPRKIHEVKPIYPEIARKARMEGVVILEITVDKQGNVRDVKILRSLPMGLTEAAVEAVKQWKYEPSTLNGRPVEVLVTVTVTFRLQ